MAWFIEKDARSMYDEGREAIEEGDWRRARKLAARLGKLRHSSSFELLALAQEGEGDLEGATATLERGLEKVPGVWPLWQLLGNFYSDAERHDEALAAYARALGCEGAEASSVEFNRGVALLRMDRNEEALQAFQRVTDGEFCLEAAANAVHTLNELGRHDEAAGLGEKTLAGFSEVENLEIAADLRAELGRALWKRDEDRERALELAREAIFLRRNSESAGWLLRELHDRRSPDGKLFELQIRGEWAAPMNGEELDFLTNCTVVADTPERALELAAEFEPEVVRPSLALESFEAVEDAPDEPWGVYEMRGRVFFPRAAE